MPPLIKYIYGGLTLFYPMINFFRYFGKKKPDRKVIFFLSFDCDYSKDIIHIPALLSFLDKYKIKASFACIGYFIEKYPKEHIIILNSGHEILNHTFTHPSNQEINPDVHFEKLSLDEQEKEIKSMQDICQTVLNYSPAGFRLPHFGNVKNIDFNSLFKMLAKQNINYDSSFLDFQRFPGKRPDSLIFQHKKTGITEFSITTCPYHPFTAFDSYHIFRSKRFIYKFGRCHKNLLHAFRKMMELNRKTRDEVNIYLDPLDVTTHSEFEAAFQFLSSDSRIRFSTYRDYLRSTQND